MRIAEAGPWRASLALEAKFGQSTVQVSIVLDAVAAFDSKDARPLLRFDTQIDWWEKHRFLRFNVPTRLRSDIASFETQFGITKRPTTRNNSWEAAKFEVCGHRFADLSEEDYGLSILTESKYGYSVEGGLMRLSLLKAGDVPGCARGRRAASVCLCALPARGRGWQRQSRPGRASVQCPLRR